MIVSDRPILVFALTRRGCLAYARQAVGQLPGDYVLFFSAYATEPSFPNGKAVRTYRNKWEFIVNSLWSLPLLMRQIALEKRRRQCKVAYFPVFHHWNLPLLWWCRLLGIYTIITIHDGIVHRGERINMVQASQDYCIYAADELIFLTEYVQRTVINRLKVRAKTRIVPHGLIALPGMHASFDRIHRPALRLLFLGRISPYKGVELLLEAVSRLPASAYAHLTIAGMPLYDLPVPVNDPRIIYLPGWHPESMLSDLLQKHDVLVLPYTEATQSGVITLGIQAAIPMIVTRVGGLEEQLSPDEALWVNPVAAEICEAIEELSGDEAVYVNLHNKIKMRLQQ